MTTRWPKTFSVNSQINTIQDNMLVHWLPLTLDESVGWTLCKKDDNKQIDYSYFIFLLCGSKIPNKAINLGLGFIRTINIA